MQNVRTKPRRKRQRKTKQRKNMIQKRKKEKKEHLKHQISIFMWIIYFRNETGRAAHDIKNKKVKYRWVLYRGTTEA